MAKVLLVDSFINEKYKLHCIDKYNGIFRKFEEITNIDNLEQLDIVLKEIKEGFEDEIKTFLDFLSDSNKESLKVISIISDASENKINIENICIQYYTEKDWFRKFIEVEIHQPEELLKLMESNKENELNKHYILMNNIDMTDFVCHSIGKSDKLFSGHFNGNNKIITINKVGENFNGLFGFIKEGSIIENINLVININEYFINNYYSSGALCGKNDKGLINNCVVKFTEGLNFNNISKEVNYTGGLCGYNTGLINHCNINFNSLILNTHFNFGVICGYNSGVINNTNVSITKDCKIYLSKDKYANMGFLVGVNDKKDSIITNCMGAFGSISIFNADTSFNIGGIVGYNYFGLVNSCNVLFNGDFEIENEMYFGGIAYTNNGSIINSSSILKKCKNVKNIINNPGKIIDVNVLIYNEDNLSSDKEVPVAPSRPPSMEINSETVKQIQKTSKSEDGTNWFWITLLIILTVVAIIVFFLFFYCDCHKNHQVIGIKNII